MSKSKKIESVQNAYLTDKRIILDNPGSKKIGLYYTEEEISVNLLECSFRNGRYRTNLSSTSFGSSGSANIPNANFISTVYLQVQLNDIITDQCVNRGWLFAMIRSIDFVFGSSSVSNIQINGQSLFQINMLQCESEEKASQMLKLAGDVIDTPTSNIFGQIVIPLPFSSVCALYAKKPYDMTMLNSPFQINIHFNDNTSIYGGSGVKPNSFLSAQILARQGQLSFPNQSLKQMIRGSNLSYTFPVLHKQSFTASVVSGALDIVSNLASCNLLLQQFINSDLFCIIIGVIKQTDIQNAVGNTPNPFNYVDLKNVRLLFNGSVLYDCPNRIHELYQMTEGLRATYFQNNIVQPGLVQPFLSTQKNTNLFVADFSQDRQLCFADSPNGWSNTVRISNQTLTCEFDVEDANTSYFIYCTYVYQGLIQTTSAGDSIIYYS